MCHSSWNYSAPTGRIFVKFDIWVFFEKPSRKFKFNWNLTRINGNLHEDRYTFMTISRSVLLRMRNVSNKIYIKNQNTHFVYKDIFENRVVCEIMWKNIVQPARPQMTIWRMRTVRWITKATDTHSEYLLLFPLQQWLHKRSSILLIRTLPLLFKSRNEWEQTTQLRADPVTLTVDLRSKFVVVIANLHQLHFKPRSVTLT